MGGRLVLLHINRVSLYDPNDLVAQGYHQQELARQTDTAAILYQQAEGLRTTATVEVATDLLPAVAQDLAHRYQPALFVLSQADDNRPAAADLMASAAGLSGYLGELFHRSITAHLLLHGPMLVLPAAAELPVPQLIDFVAAAQYANMVLKGVVPATQKSVYQQNTILASSPGVNLTP